MSAIDPSTVNAGDTVTVAVKFDNPEFRDFTLRGEVYNAMEGASLYVGGWPLQAQNVTLTAHQPAPEPEVEWKPGTVGTATVRGVDDVRVLRSHRTGSVASEFWLSDSEVDGYLQHQDPHVTDVRPLVVIDPAAVDVDALFFVYSRHDGDARSSLRAVLAELGIEVAR
jgi:hypothetical protein